MKGVAYRIPLPMARAQGTSNADRPVCAMVAAYASLLRGEPALGVLRGEPDPIGALAAAIMTEHGVPRGRLTEWALGLNGAKVPLADVPTSVNGMVLEDFQRNAVASLAPAGGILALGCGLGKTLAACAYAQAIKATSVVILCPLNAIPTWTRHKPMLPAGTIIYSMDSAHHLLGMQPVDLIIYDEAHLQGHFTATRTKNAHKLRLKAKSGVCLTGTLLHAGIIKSLSVLDLAIPGASGFSTRWAAGEHFHCLIRKEIGGRTVTELGQPPQAQRAAYHAYLARHTVAMTHTTESVASVLQLPGQDVYDMNLNEPWTPIDRLSADMALEVYADTGEMPTAAAIVHRMLRHGIEAKTDWVMQHLEDEPLVIFAHYTASLDMMEEKLKTAKITYTRVDGEVVGKDRAEAQRKFQSSEVQVFLGQLSAAGISMDLFRAPYSIALDHPGKAADYAQALARTHRRGQTTRCHHWDLFANGLQRRLVQRLRAGEDFNSETAEWQQVRYGLTLINT